MYPAVLLPLPLQGGISAEGEKACRQLRSLHPAEALGVICWVLEEVGTQVSRLGKRDEFQGSEELRRMDLCPHLAGLGAQSAPSSTCQGAAASCAAAL